jgi:hypothetical protein
MATLAAGSDGDAADAGRLAVHDRQSLGDVRTAPGSRGMAVGRRSTYVVESGSGIRVGVNVWSSSRPGLIRP